MKIFPLGCRLLASHPTTSLTLTTSLAGLLLDSLGCRGRPYPLGGTQRQHRSAPLGQFLDSPLHSPDTSALGHLSDLSDRQIPSSQPNLPICLHVEYTPTFRPNDLATDQPPFASAQHGQICTTRPAASQHLRILGGLCSQC